MKSSALVALLGLLAIACGSAQVRDSEALVDPAAPSHYAYYDHRDVAESATPAPSSGASSASPGGAGADRDEPAGADEPASPPAGGASAGGLDGGDDDDEP